MKMQKKILVPVVAVLVVICLIVGVLLIKKYKPNNKEMSLMDYFKAEKGQVQVILQDTKYETPGIWKDGHVYVDMDMVRQYLNARFYWDRYENQLLYTTANSVITVQKDSDTFLINKSRDSKDYTIVQMVDTTPYVALDFVKEYSAFTYKKYDQPDRVVITYRFGEKADYVKAEEKAKLRCRATIKSEILLQLKKDQKLLVLAGQDNKDSVFYKAMTEDGVTGYIRKKDTGDLFQEEQTSDFQEEKYPHILKDKKVNLVWHQVTTAAANDGVLNLLGSTKGVNVVAPTWFTVSGNKGEITSLASDEYVSRVHGVNAEVWGLCNDFGKDSKIGKVLERTTTRTKLEKNLLAEAIRYSLDGLNIDFEHVKQVNGEDFIQFIRELGIMCRNNGIVLSIDNYPPTDYSQYYNRTEQAAVADYVITMAYDEYYAGSEEAGPVSSLNYVQTSTADTLEQVPAEQTIIALPFYSRLWKETTKDGTTKVTSEAYSMKYAKEALSDAKADVKWDDATGMNYGEYQKDGALYKMWLEDEQSLEKKMQAVSDAKTAGYAFWKLGLEQTSTWDMISKYIN